MPVNLPQPITYLITAGQTTHATTPATEEFQKLLELIEAAARAHVSLIQLREKSLNARTLYELTTRACEITRGTNTRLLVNDRADIARAAGADGVHLTTQSLRPDIIRQTFGSRFLIGVSAHSLAEAQAARTAQADFAVFGPVFDTPSKLPYGQPLGLDQFREAARALAPFPLLALGGITRQNARDCLRAGASGIAAIRLFSDPHDLDRIAREIYDEPR